MPFTSLLSPKLGVPVSSIVAFPDPTLSSIPSEFEEAWLDPAAASAAESIPAERLFLDVALDPRHQLAHRCEVAAYLAATYPGARLNEEALPRLDSSVAAERQVAALLIGSPGNLRAIFPLVALLDDPVVAVRRAAVRGLAGVRDHRVLSFLLGVLDHDDDLIVTALSALKLFPLELTSAIFDAHLDHGDREVSLAALGAFRFAQAADASARALGFLSHPDARHRALAVTLLEQNGRRRHLEPLLPLLGDADVRVRHLCQEAIAAIRARR